MNSEYSFRLNTTRKQKEIEFKKEQIVKVAEKLYVEKGIENVSMNDIAKASEYSKTTLYKYFKSKEDIEIFVYRSIHQDKLEVLKEYLIKGKTGPEKIRHFTEGYLNFWKENPEALKIQLSWDYKGLDRTNLSDEILYELNQAYVTETPMLNQMIEVGIKDGDFRNDLDIADTTETFYLLLRSILNQMFIINKDEAFSTMFVDTSNSYTRFVEIFIRGLRP